MDIMLWRKIGAGILASDYIIQYYGNYVFIFKYTNVNILRICIYDISIRFVHEALVYALG